MAVEVLRIPTAGVFAYADLESSQPVDTHQRYPTDISAAFTPRQSSERIGLKASVRSVVYGPISAPVEDVPCPSSPQTQPVDRRASKISMTGDIDGLISQLDQTKIQTAALSSSRRVQVPKGFELGMAYDISNFYRQQSEARRFDKRKRDLGVLPKRSGPHKHGFRPEELLWYGAMELKDCKASNLDNEIHPLLAQDRFDDTPDHIYDQLIPGLRLASQFLSHPSCMHFWVTLAKGERRVDRVMSERYHKIRHRISRNVPMTKENVNEVIGYMKDHGKAKAIHFTFAPGLAYQGSSAFGTAHTICNFQSDSEGRREGNVQCCQPKNFASTEYEDLKDLEDPVDSNVAKDVIQQEAEIVGDDDEAIKDIEVFKDAGRGVDAASIYEVPATDVEVHEKPDIIDDADTKEETHVKAE
ncbi:MAG: hypothetical protein Q9171_000701 [Xanthocarpia ochracea]